MPIVTTYGADGAEAAGISCGDVIKNDTTLRRDLLNCPNAGLIIGADGVTLDLNGHMVDGDNKLAKECPEDSKTDFCEDGVVNEGHSGVTVVGGEVREFAFGVSFYNADDGEVRETTATRNIFNGIIFFRASNSLLSGATAAANGLEHDYPGIAIVESDGNRIERTTSTGNADLGFYVTESNNNVFVHNTLSANPEAGAIIDGDGNVVRGNRIVRNGDGLVMDGSNNTIARNQIQRSLGCGNGCGVGISLEDGSGNRIVGNVIRSPKETGITAEDVRWPTEPPRHDRAAKRRSGRGSPWHLDRVHDHRHDAASKPRPPLRWRRHPCRERVNDSEAKPHEPQRGSGNRRCAGRHRRRRQPGRWQRDCGSVLLRDLRLRSASVYASRRRTPRI